MTLRTAEEVLHAEILTNRAADLKFRVAAGIRAVAAGAPAEIVAAAFGVPVDAITPKKKP